MKGKYKIVGQIGIGLIVGLVLWASPDVKMNENLAIERQGQETVVKHRTEATKVAEDHHSIRQGTQPRLLQHHQFLR